MNTCSTCKFWGDQSPEDNWNDHQSDIGGVLVKTCTNVPMFWDSTKWDDDGESRVFADKYKDTLAFAQDGSDYSACLLTRPNFGCVSHKAKR